MTTNLFVIANVKQLRTGGSLKFYCLFSEHLGGVVLNSVIINSFHNRVEFGTILEGLRNFGGGGGGGFEPPHPHPSRYATGQQKLHVVCIARNSTPLHQAPQA